MEQKIDKKILMELAEAIDSLTKIKNPRMPCPMCGSTDYEDDSEYGCENPESEEFEDEPEHIEIRKQKLKDKQIQEEHINKIEREFQRHDHIMEEIKALKDAGVTVYSRPNSGKANSKKKGK